MQSEGFWSVLGHIMSVFAFILAMLMLRDCMCSAEEEEEQGAEVVMSEPPILILTAPAGCMLGQGEPVIKFGSSESQV